MSKCDVCGNTYDKAFQVILAGETYTFDSFECAVHRLAQHCAHCDCMILGHGVEANGAFYCCAHCAKEGGAQHVNDREGEGATQQPH
jgi:hypothetical protein